MTFVDTAIFPNLLYLLLVAGLWLSALAIVSPGTGILEGLAFITLVLAGFGTLYLDWNVWAVVVLAGGAVLLFLSVRLPRSEIWLGASALAFCVGSVFMFRVEAGGPAVHPALAVVVSLLTLGFFWLSIRKALAAHQAQPTIDLSVLLGQIGEVRTPLDPIGSAYVAGELWTARCDVRVEAGTNVKVLDRDGLVLIVEPIEILEHDLS
jgi:membrane-bound serine protease (ClpP class)